MNAISRCGRPDFDSAASCVKSIMFAEDLHNWLCNRGWRHLRGADLRQIILYEANNVIDFSIAHSIDRSLLLLKSLIAGAGFWEMLTAKGKYGLKALVYLATLEPNSTAHGNEIAKASNISKKFLDAILSELRNAGIVKSRKGPGGGYMLARSPRTIKAGLVIRTLDGPLAPIACASRSAYRPCRDCKSVANCEVRRAMAKVRDATANILDKLSIADMVRKS